MPNVNSAVPEAMKTNIPPIVFHFSTYGHTEKTVV